MAGIGIELETKMPTVGADCDSGTVLGFGSVFGIDVIECIVKFFFNQKSPYGIRGALDSGKIFGNK